MERLAFIMSRNGEGTFYTDGGIWQVGTFAFEDTQNDEAHIVVWQENTKIIVKIKVLMHYEIV